MEWRDQALVLNARAHGETSVILEVFSAAHGRHLGVVRGGISRKMAPAIQPGATVDVTWKARLEGHMGAFTVEPVRSRSAALMNDRLALAGVNALSGLLPMVLPEREVHGRLYDRTSDLLDLMGNSDLWPLAYLRWELTVLEDLGYGLDLDSCAVTGTRDDLVYVSPRSGRAVSPEGAGEWADRMLPLPPELLGGNGVFRGDGLVQAMQTTGHFLKRLLEETSGKDLPAARGRLMDLFGRLD